MPPKIAKKEHIVKIAINALTKKNTTAKSSR